MKRRRRRWCLSSSLPQFLLSTLASFIRVRFVSSRCCTAKVFFSTWISVFTARIPDAKYECKTHRNEVACWIRRSNHRCWVAKDLARCVGGHEVSEDHDERENHLHSQSLPWWHWLSVWDRSLKISLIAWQRDSESEREKLEINPSTRT